MQCTGLGCGGVEQESITYLVQRNDKDPCNVRKSMYTHFFWACVWRKYGDTKAME